MAEIQQAVRSRELKSTGLDLPKMQQRSGPNSIGYCEEYVRSSLVMLTRTGVSLAENQQSVRSIELKRIGAKGPKMPRPDPNSIAKKSIIKNVGSKRSKRVLTEAIGSLSLQHNN